MRNTFFKQSNQVKVSAMTDFNNTDQSTSSRNAYPNAGSAFLESPNDAGAIATAACAKVVALGDMFQSRHQQNAFLYDLFDIISDGTNGSIISWLGHGKGFIIKDKRRFELEILPDFLPNIKFSSFTRRLKRWNFFRVPSGVEIGAYYHENFQRGKPQLISGIGINQLQPIDSESQIYPSSPVNRPHRLFPKTKTSFSLKNNNCNDDKYIAHDTRDFPQIMRVISKVKRMENIARKRSTSDIISHYLPAFPGNPDVHECQLKRGISDETTLNYSQSVRGVSMLANHGFSDAVAKDPFEPIPYSSIIASKQNQHRHEYSDDSFEIMRTFALIFQPETKNYDTK